MNNPKISTEGGKMECELQPTLKQSGMGCGLCLICGQMTGRGLSHPCTVKNQRIAKHVGRSRSMAQNSVQNRKKRNLSVLVGREKNEAVEQIVGKALKNIAARKGKNFRLRQMEGGGFEGKGEEIEIGSGTSDTTVLPVQIFQEVKKSLNLGKSKMQELCKIIRRHKVKMAPNVRIELREIDHLLDKEYMTLRVKVVKKGVLEIEDNSMQRKRNKKLKTSKTIERDSMIKVERDITILKDTKSFVSRLIQERGLFEGDVMHRVSIDGGDRSVKVILNTFDRNYDPEISFPKLETKGNLLSGVN